MRAPAGELEGDVFLRPAGSVLFVEHMEGARVVRVTHRSKPDAGVVFRAERFLERGSDCRLVVTGRLNQLSVPPGAGAALSVPGSEDVLAFLEPLSGLYSVSCLLDGAARGGVLIAARKAGQPVGGFDFFVDGILVLAD